MNTSAISKDRIWILLPILAGVTVGLIVRENVIFCGGLCLAFFILLVKKPELSMAILFNGTIIYFYLIYKLDIETGRLLTGYFYAYLAFSYILGGMLLITKRHNFRVRPIDILFTCFFIWVFLSYYLFNTGSKSAYMKIAYAPLLVIVPYFGIRFLSSEKRIKKFFDYCVLLAATLIIPSLYELLFNPTLAKAGGFSLYLMKDGGANHILFGITFAILLLIVFVKAYEKKENKFKCLIFIIPSTYLLLRSGSRGALLSLIVTAIFYFLFITTIGLRRKIFAIVGFILLIAVAYKFMPESTIESYKTTFEYKHMSAKASSVLQRMIFWEQAANDFKKNPILGVGIGNSVGGIGMPHNILLEVSAELGAVGLFVFLSMCYLTAKKAITFLKIEERQDLRLLMKLSLLLFIYNLVEAMFSGYITNQTHMFMSMALIASLTGTKLYGQFPQGCRVEVIHG
jgi:O-antigen ligase